MKDIGSEVEISLDLWILFHLFRSKGDEIKTKAVLYSLDYQNKSGEEAKWVVDKWEAFYLTGKPDLLYEKILNEKFKLVFCKKRNISFLNKHIIFSIEIEKKNETQHLEKIFSDTSCFVLNFNYLDRILKEVIASNLSLLSEKAKFIIRFNKSSEKLDIHIFLNKDEKFLGIEMVEVYSPNYEERGSVMRDIYSMIENENWEKIKRKEKTGMVRLESHAGEDLTYRICIKRTRIGELLDEAKKSIEEKLKKEYFQNSEFEIMVLWVMLFPQFYYLDVTYDLPPKREIKEKIVESFLREKLSEKLQELGKLIEKVNFFLFNYLETWRPVLKPTGMEKSHYTFNTNFLMYSSDFLLRKQPEHLAEPRISYPRLIYIYPKKKS